MSLSDEIENKADLKRWLIQELLNPGVLPQPVLSFQNLKFGSSSATWEGGEGSKPVTITHGLGLAPAAVAIQTRQSPGGFPQWNVSGETATVFTVQGNVLEPSVGTIEFFWLAVC